LDLLDNAVFGTGHGPVALHEIASKTQRLRRGGTSLQAGQML
jgi:hypothetical protein